MTFLACVDLSSNENEAFRSIILLERVYHFENQKPPPPRYY